MGLLVLNDRLRYAVLRSYCSREWYNVDCKGKLLLDARG